MTERFKTFDLSPTCKVHIWVGEDALENGWVYMDIDQKGRDIQQRIWATVEQLEDVARVGKWVHEQERPEKERAANVIDERVSGFDVSYLKDPEKADPKTTRVVLREELPGGKARVFQTSLERIEILVAEGRAAEHEKLVEPDSRYSIAVKMSSIERHDNQSITATIERIHATTKVADVDINNNESLAYLERQRRWPRGDDNTIEVRPEDIINIGKGKTRTVGEQAKLNEQVRDSIGAYTIIAVWDGHRLPEIGMKVSWSEGGETYDGERLEFKARPEHESGGAEYREKLYVLIRRDHLDRRPGHGDILDASPDWKVMASELKKFEQSQKERDIPLSQRSFGMERE